VTGGALRAVLVVLAALAAVGCLAAAARMRRPADRRTLASLGATLGACAAVTLGREVDAAPWSALLDALGVGIVGALLVWLLRARGRR
jgi:uncharacterized membrane protein